MLKVRSLIVIAGCVFFGTLKNSLAQNYAVEKNAKALGIPSTSRFYASLVHDSDGAPTATPQPQQLRIGQKPVAAVDTTKIIRHYRGTFGSPFTPPPSKAEIIAKTKIPTEVKQKTLEIAHDAWQLPLKYLPAPSKDLPNCLVNRTEQTAIPKNPNSKPGSLILDYLFVRKDETPIDPAKTFGERTTVFEFGGSDDTAAYLALAVKATCLPYRVRITKKNIFRHFGLDALANFDKQFDGKGKLDKSVLANTKKVKK